MENRVETILQEIQSLSTQEIVFKEELILEAYNKNEKLGSSLMIKILSVIGGLFATSAFSSFLALAGIYESEFGMVFTGAILVLASVLLNKKSEHIITDTFSVTSYIVGLSLFLFGMSWLGETSLAILALLVGFSTLYLTQHYILSFIATLVISASLFFNLIILNESYSVIHIYNTLIAIAMSFVFLFESNIITRSKKLSKLYNPVRIGLIISFLFGLGVLRTRYLFDYEINYTWFYSVVLFVILILIVNKILNKLEVTAQRIQIFAYLISASIFVLTAFSPSILGAVLLILLSFYVNYRTGFILGLITLIFSVFQYYYDLNFTLLTKSILLICSGVLFLALYFLISKNKKNEEL